MKMMLSLLFSAFIAFGSAAQQFKAQDSSWKKIYRFTPKRINDLVHTKLDVRFNYEKAELYGESWITLTPHVYPTDSLRLDAKGMELHEVALVTGTGAKSKLNYSYDNYQVLIKLSRTYKKGDKYTVYIKYTSRPEYYQSMVGGDPMLGVKGLYFINPKGTDKRKPIQIWTQGETESNSVWFPTIDQTQQKTTQETIMTVRSNYVTLSNGKLVSQKMNKDGTRTDHWKMDLPHAPYLFFMGVGDYAVIKDSWKGKEVNYYVEPEYASVAKKIFGNTPEMMTYFSKITGVDYPWVKYSQITGREYVAGAMENTTATIHQETAQQDARQLTDGNIWEGTIAHELFHHWFGDLVTAESWSHLTLNESFADYSQTLWYEYKFGKDAGDAENYYGMQGYLMGANEHKDLVRFYYADREDMFDAVSYQKGGRILHMLRKHIGDSAFFKGINIYLTTNKFKSAEAHHLRLAFEEASGEDLTWFFNQWYFGNGHPKLDIDYAYDPAKKMIRVTVKQNQNSGKVFRIPTTVDVYHGKNKTRHPIWIENRIDTFHFPSPSTPDLINFDGEKILLCEKSENKTLDQYIHQYHHAGNFVDRREAIEFAGNKMDEPKAILLIRDAIGDPFNELRNLALEKIDLNEEKQSNVLENKIAQAVLTEKRRTVKASMITALGVTGNEKYKKLYLDHIEDSSYTLSGAALEALSKIDSALALDWAKKMASTPLKGKIDNVVNKLLIASGDESVFDRIQEKFLELGLTEEKFQMLQQLGGLAVKMSSQEKAKQALLLIIQFRDKLPAGIKEQVAPYINNMILGDALNQFRKAGKSAMVKFLEERLNK